MQKEFATAASFGEHGSMLPGVIDVRLLIGVPIVLAISSAGAAAECGRDNKLLWSGGGTQTTRPFHMDGGWEVQWTMTKAPMVFQIMVHNKADPDGFPDIAANQNDASPGSAYRPRGGDYFLTFNTFGGSWTACVVPVP